MLIKPCEACSKPMRLPPSKENRTRFCSKACQKAAERKITLTCEYCGLVYQDFECRSNQRFCSRLCHNRNTGDGKRGLPVKSKVVSCAFCGLPVTKPESRIAAYERPFCGNDCYHAWDREYKRTPAMKRKHAKRMIAMSGKPSGVEMRVAAWLTSHSIQFEQQVKIHYSLADFKAGNTYIEVNGCYWHGCAEHFPMITPRQQKRISRDKRLATYCRKRAIPLIIIWEHDVNRGDFSALMPLLPVGLP